MATVYMSLDLPVEDGDDGIWDTKVNTALEAIDAHNHTSGSGRQVPSAGLDIDADLSIGGNSLTSVQQVLFSTAAPAGTLGLMVGTDNELYWRTSGGASVKLTDGTSLNTSLVGGITGDYSTTDADLEYSDSGKSFAFYQDDTTSPQTWARIGSEQHFIFPAGNGIIAVGLKAPAGLSGDYSITLPTAPPGSGDQPLTMNSSGVLQAGAELSAFSVKSNEDVTLQGTGRVKHGGYTMTVPSVAAAFPVGSASYSSGYVALVSADVVDIGIPIQTGKRITAVQFTHYKTNSGTTNFSVRKIDSSGSESAIGTTTRTTTSGWESVEISGLTDTVSDEEFFWGRVTGSSSGERISGITVTYDDV